MSTGRSDAHGAEARACLADLIALRRREIFETAPAVRQVAIALAVEECSAVLAVFIEIEALCPADQETLRTDLFALAGRGCRTEHPPGPLSLLPDSHRTLKGRFGSEFRKARQLFARLAQYQVVLAGPFESEQGDLVISSLEVWPTGFTVNVAGNPQLGHVPVSISDDAGRVYASSGIAGAGDRTLFVGSCHASPSLGPSAKRLSVFFGDVLIEVPLHGRRPVEPCLRPDDWLRHQLAEIVRITGQTAAADQGVVQGSLQRRLRAQLQALAVLSADAGASADVLFDGLGMSDMSSVLTASSAELLHLPKPRPLLQNVVPLLWRVKRTLGHVFTLICLECWSDCARLYWAATGGLIPAAGIRLRDSTCHDYEAKRVAGGDLTGAAASHGYVEFPPLAMSMATWIIVDLEVGGQTWSRAFNVGG